MRFLDTLWQEGFVRGAKERRNRPFARHRWETKETLLSYGVRMMQRIGKDDDDSFGPKDRDEVPLLPYDDYFDSGKTYREREEQARRDAQLQMQRAIERERVIEEERRQREKSRAEYDKWMRENFARTGLEHLPLGVRAERGDFPRRR